MARLVVGGLLVAGCGAAGAPAAGPAEPVTGNVSAGRDPAPAPDPLLAWIQAPTCPAGTVLIGEAGDDLSCWDIDTTYPHGPSVGWSDGRILVTGSFDGGFQDGTWTWYGPGGVESQGQWRRGRKVGLWRVWDEGGALLRTYDLGTDGTGVNEIWRGGVLVERRQHRDGCADGRWEALAPDGSVRASFTMTRGSGSVAEFDDAGRLSRRSTWRDCDEIQDAWFDEHGALVTERFLERQFVVRTRQYQGGVLTAERADYLDERRARVAAALGAAPP
jgi:antitoxin component YwqK of YwqJK toxin-antitoxin module